MLNRAQPCDCVGGGARARFSIICNCAHLGKYSLLRNFCRSVTELNILNNLNPAIVTA